jgi:glycosidase
MKVDGMFGGKAALENLIRQTKARGMRLILDGVFNHTGDDSKYFNRRGNYHSLGAYQSEDSPYQGWYRFRSFPDAYECWWNIEILPRLNQENPECRRYFTGEDGIVRRWLEAGADGWRLDVADELPDAFLDELRATVKKTTGGEGLIIGEVWENAATKIAYGKRRRYFGGKQLDSVMNYPFRSAVLAFLTEGDAEFFYDTMTEIYASYPKEVSDSLMNLLGSHDTQRILTVLGDVQGRGDTMTNAQLAAARLSAEERRRGISLLKMASALQYTVFGVPSLYYGDEAGLEGYQDPFCRMPYPWGREDEELLAHYRHLGKMRMEHQALRDGDFRFLVSDSKGFAYERRSEEDVLVVAANMGKTSMRVPIEGVWRELLTGKIVSDPTVGEGEIAVYCKAEK